MSIAFRASPCSCAAKAAERNHVLGKDAILKAILAIEHDLPELVGVVWLEEQLLVLEAAFHTLVHVVDVLDLVADRDDTDATVDFPRLLSAREFHQYAVVVHQIYLVEDNDHRIKLSVERLPEEFVVFRRAEAGIGDGDSSRRFIVQLRGK